MPERLEVSMDKTGRKIKIGLIQERVTPDISYNLQRSIGRVREAAGVGAEIVCLQELFRTIYFPQYKEIEKDRFAETVPGESTDAFSSLAEELSIVVIVPVFERDRKGEYYNTAVVIDADGTLMGRYRKTHIPYDPFFYEKDYFKDGSSGYPVFKTRYGVIGVLICYDQWFPEAARILAIRGAEIIFYPTAIGWVKGDKPVEGDWRDAWETVQKGHAIANSIYVAAVNRAGEEGNLEFWGGSFLCGPFGNIIKRAGSEDDVVVANADLSMNRKIREDWGFLRNRRPDTYKLLLNDICNPSGADSKKITKG